MTNDNEFREYALCDESTMVSFEGTRLAFASSQAPGKTRWSEIAIYRTSSGKYVVHGVGRSIVKGETDRSWCNVVTSGAGVIDRLTRREGDVHFIPYVPNRAVAEAAAKVDEEIHTAYYNHRVA